MDDPPYRRVMLIQDGSTPLGTGCLLDGTLVLTTGRVLLGNRNVIVVYGAGELFRAEPEWIGQDDDAALLRIVDGTFSELPALPLDGALPLSGSGPRQADAVGYAIGSLPRAASRADYVARVRSARTHAIGDIPEIDKPDGSFQLQVTSVPTSPGGLLWLEGMSGSPVWVGEQLFGMLTEGDATGNRFRGVRLDYLLADDSFARVVSPGRHETYPASCSPC